MLGHGQARSGLVVLVVAGVLLTVYVATLLPGVGYSGDTAKFQFAGPILGTVHPTGCPTYLMLSHVLGRALPWGRLAWRINLLSAICAAVAGGFAGGLLMSLGVAPAPATASALALGVSPLFWSQAVVAEVYALHAALMMTALWLLAGWRTAGGYRDLYAALLVLAVSLGNHMTTVLIAPGVAVYVLRHEPRLWRSRRVVAWSVLCLAAGLGQYGYCIWRSRDPTTRFLETTTTSLGDLWRCITGARYHAQMFAWPVQTILGQRLPDLLGQILRDLTILVPLAIYGLMRVRLRGWRTLMTVYAGCQLAFAAGYANSDIAVYLLPVHLVVVLLAGIGLGDLSARIPERAQFHRLAAAACLALPVYFFLHDREIADRSGDIADARHTESILAAAGEDAVILTADYREACFLRYYVLGEGLQEKRSLYVQDFAGAEQIVAYLRGEAAPVTKGQSSRVPAGLAVVTTNDGLVESLRSCGSWAYPLAGGLVQGIRSGNPC
jgi:hypothetical protein